MYRVSVLIVFAFCVTMYSCTGCKQKPVPKTTAERLTELRDSFAFAQIDSFEIDTLGYDERQERYKEVDSADFNLVWQGLKQYNNSGTIKTYYYSWQQRDSNYTEFTVLYQSEDEYCYKLEYLIYNKRGKLISHFDLAASCGDGGWYFTGSGKFIANDTYQYSTIETNMASEDSLSYEMLEGDSITKQFVIGYNGRTMERPISQQHFTAIDSTTNSEPAP